MKFLIFFILPCLLVTAGRDLPAQGNHASLQKLTDRYYSLEALNMSNDGKWLTIRKTYNLNSDTVLIFSSLYPERSLGFRTNVKYLTFLNNNTLLINGLQHGELFNPEKQTSIYFKEAQQVQASANKEQFIVHYNEKGKNRLELRDCNDNLINTINNVSRFYTTKHGVIYAIVENVEKGYDVFVLKGDTSEKVYSTTNVIYSLEADNDGQWIMINEQNSDTDYKEVSYLDLVTKNCFPLKEVLPEAVLNGFGEEIREGEIYFLRLWIREEKADTSLVDIWYGNDNKLEEKFYSPVREVYYVWEPCHKRIQRIGSDMITKVANIGSENYFFVFNPYSLQDYTQNTPLKINIYDRKEDCYSLMDTISDALYTSPDGQYASYQRNRAWFVYQNATGTKRIIGSENLRTPCFTNDSKTLLFEGDGGLWCYDLIKRELRQLKGFRGYRVSILNAQSRSTLRGYNFFERTFNLEDPLVLKLYDSKENKSAYLLWENGEYKTIIPPTTMYVRSLNYNKSFDSFSWIEEDYNLPPRIAFTRAGEDKKVLYQSNKADTAILSLRQEIISYANSDGLPLKGILFYPLNYNSSEKYPMVVSIYERQRHLSNRYPYPSYYEGIGFNIRLLIEKGYFVYLPDILIQGKEGPGVDAMDCVNKAMDSLNGILSIDKHRIGLIGHSFGSYETDYIATHSNRFAVYVSGSGHSDIVWAYHSFNYNFKWPEYKRIEVDQYKMGAPFSNDKALYLNNNPAYDVRSVSAPVLLWSGLDDKNVPSDQTMAFYNALRRNKKDVIALYYKDEGHSLQNRQAQFDLTSRILEWFDYFLKENSDIEWINKRVKKDAQ